MNRRMKSILMIVIAFATGAGLIGFASSEHDGKHCNDVIVTIENKLNNHYIDELEVLQLINNNGATAVIGEPYASINIRAIEERVKSEPYIRDAQLFRDHSGNLIVNVVQRRPVARIIRPDGPDAYIADDGVLLPVSDKFSTRVVLVSGVGTKWLSERESIAEGDGSDLFDLVQYINNDVFLKAQIAQIHFEHEDEIVLYPQMTKQNITFGGFEDMEIKFKKLMLFYKQILPRKGWNVYKKVNLKYKDQIICE